MAVERCELHHTVKEDGVISAGSETLVEGLTQKSEGEENHKAGYAGCVKSGVEYYAVNTVHVGTLTAGEKITITV